MKNGLRGRLFQIAQFLLFVVLLVLFSDNTKVLYDIIKVYSITSLVVFIYTNPFSFLSPYFFIMLFLYTYNFGELWLVIFNIPLKDSTFSIRWFSTETVVRGYIYVLLFTLLVQLFVTLANNKEKRLLRGKDNLLQDEDLEERKIIEQVSTLLFPVVFVLATIFDVSQIITASQYGYVKALTSRTDSSVLTIANALMPLLIITLSYSSANSIKRNGVFLYGLLRYTIYMVIMGSRLLPISMYFCLLLIHYKDKRFDTKLRVTMSIAITAIIVLGTFMASYRHNDIDVAISSIKNRNPIIAMIQEMGGTFVDVPLIMENIDIIGYAYGKTYLFMLLNMLPKISILIPNIQEYSSFSSALNPFSIKGGGLGGSIVAELFYNFGWFSLLLTPVVAWVYGKISKMYRSSNPVAVCFGLYIFLIMAIYVRGTAGEVTDYMRILLYSFIFRAIASKRGIISAHEKKQH